MERVARLYNVLGRMLMFTWNFQFISRSRLIDTFNQLKLDPANGDILIRIHTAAHYAD